MGEEVKDEKWIGLEDAVLINNELIAWVGEKVGNVGGKVWGGVLYIGSKIGEILDKEKLIYYGRRYIGGFGLTEEEREDFQEGMEDAIVESLGYAIAAGIATEVGGRGLKRLAELFGKGLLKRYGKKIAAKFIGKFIPVVGRTLFGYALYDLAKNDYEIHRRCNTDGGVFDGKPQAYWCGRLMVDGLLMIAGVGVVGYKGGKLVGKYRRIKILSAELEKRGVKFTKDAIIDIRKLRGGQIFWLEKGDDKRGYYHIFIQKREGGLTRYEQMVLGGVVSSKQELIDLIFKIVDKGKKEVVALSSGRLGWVFSMNVKGKKVIVATGTNGFIVTVSIVKK